MATRRRMTPQIKAGIFAGESGGDYDALFGFSNRPGGRFAGTRISDMTVDQAINFAHPRGEYATWVRNKIGRTATPMGGFQIVGDTLKQAKNWAGLSGNERMTQDIQDRLGEAVLQNQGTGAWAGYKGPRNAKAEYVQIPPSGSGPRKEYVPPGTPAVGVQVASADPNYWPTVEEPEEEESRMGKISSTLADTSQLMSPRPAPMSFPPVIVNQSSPVVQMQPKLFEEPVLTSMEPGTPPFGSPNAPYGFKLPENNPGVLDPETGTLTSRPSAGGASIVVDPSALAANPETHSFGYNAAADYFGDLFTGNAWYPGKESGPWLKNWATENFWTPEAERGGGGTVKDTSQEQILADELLFGGVKEVGGNSSASPSTGGTSVIDAGTTFLPKEPPKIEPQLYPAPPDPGDVPDRPPVADIDFQPYLERMRQYEPEDIDRKQYMRDRLWGNVARALAAGAGGSGWSGWGGSVARAGSGFGLSQAETSDEYLADQAARDEAQRQWGMGQIDLEMKLAQRAQEIQNQNANIGYENELNEYNAGAKYDLDKYNIDMKNIQIANESNQANAQAFYEWQNTVGVLTQDKMVNVTDKQLVMQKVDPEGKTTFEVHNLDDPYMGLMSDDYLKTLKSVSEQLPGSSAEYQLKYAPFLASKNKWGVQAVMAEELLVNGGLAQILPNYDELSKTAATTLEKRGLLPGQTGYDEKFMTVLTSLAAPHMNINDPNFLQQALQMRSVGAALLLGNVAQQPPGTTAAPTQIPPTGGPRVQ